jgi:anti-sigma factor RsiW
MNESSNSPWTPDPQLLAAYFDGELEGRDDVADMRARIEAWLEAHPEAADEWHKHRELQKLWLDTTPADPSPATWNQVLEQIEAKRRLGAAGESATATRRPWWALGVFAASVALFVGLSFAAMRFSGMLEKSAPVAVHPKPIEPEDVEVFAVAMAHEINIVWIDGADTGAMIVGALPLEGPMALVDSGEIRVVTCCPKLNIRQDGQHRPMVTARAEVE